jgi:hypothetical protein
MAALTAVTYGATYDQTEQNTKAAIHTARIQASYDNVVRAIAALRKEVRTCMVCHPATDADPSALLSPGTTGVLAEIDAVTTALS